MYEIFFHPKLANDTRCDTASDAPTDEFFFNKAKDHLTDTGVFGAGSDLKPSHMTVEFTLPKSSRITYGDYGVNFQDDPITFDPLINGNHRTGADPDKYAGNPGVGFTKASQNYVLSWKGTLRKAVHFDSAKEYILIRKVWSYNGSCSFWLRKNASIAWVETPPSPPAPYSFRFDYYAKSKVSGGVHGIYAVVLNSRGQMIALNQAGELLHRYESGFQILDDYIIHGSYSQELNNPTKSHAWSPWTDPDGVPY